ncbi:hypothetical protein [Tenuifilum thalassicum]|uniref:Uncharacterized protein n=1 Tax=Tenuifilum thalassicum TaxID=2590900 RepID=A0A7D4BSQ6_9BACT|nr:hypothetical protein [Tenuifilum thalassicum]QKG80621.1 hypothetical protein FHG85_10180 [Tenuifilum thalassicum]
MINLSKKESLKVFADRFYSCIVEALYLSDIKDNNKRFSENSFINHIKSINNELLIKLNKLIYKTYTKTINDNFDKFSKDLVSFLTNDLKFQINNSSKNYLTENNLNEYTEQQIKNGNYYSVQINGIDIKIQIDTVHAVKGETHTATLYLDTKYYKNSIEYFLNELNGKNNNDISERKIYALKILM